MILSPILIKERGDLVEFNILVFCMGLIFGSFLNMLIYRLPLEISLFNPKRSICTSCKKQIRWYENIPLLSYVYLKGRCSNCHEKISIVYPIVELLTATISLFLYLKLGICKEYFIILSIFYTLIILSFIDFKYKEVPDYLLLIVLILVFNLSNMHFQAMLIFAGGFAILEFILTFYIQNIKSKLTNNDELKEQKALGEGDIPIIATIGAILGVKLALIAIFLSAIFAIIPSGCFLTRKMHLSAGIYAENLCRPQSAIDR